MIARAKEAVLLGNMFIYGLGGGCKRMNLSRDHGRPSWNDICIVGGIEYLDQCKQ